MNPNAKATRIRTEDLMLLKRMQCLIGYLQDTPVSGAEVLGRALRELEKQTLAEMAKKQDRKEQGV